MVQVDGHGVYVPLYRIKRETIAEQYGNRLPRGELAVPGRDENLITMGSEAAKNALDRSSVDGPDVTAVFAASVSDEFAEHGIAAHVAYRIGAEGDVRTGDFRATPRAAGDAIVAAKHFVEANGGCALVVGVDIMPVEPDDDDEAFSGAGGGAVVLTEDDIDDPTARIVGVGQHTNGFVEDHRLHGEPRTEGDQRFVRSVGYTETLVPPVREALDTLSAPPERFILQAFDPKARLDVEGFTSDAERDSTFDDVGYAGTATFFLDLSWLFENAQPGTPAVAVSYGAGGADAIALETDVGVDDDTDVLGLEDYLETKEYLTYAQHLKKREPPEDTEVPV